MEGSLFAGLSDTQIALLALVVLLTIPFKAWALWLAARRGEKIWFVAVLLLNTLAILELIYIFFVAKRNDGRDEGSSR